MAVVTQADGTFSGSFKIPANVKAGTKQVIFRGSRGSHAETTFTGQGTVVTNTMRQVKNVMQSYYDPLAQTFLLNDPRQLSSVDVFVVNAADTPLIVQLRETSVGFPTRTIIAEGRVNPGDPAYKSNSWVKVTFDTPFYASANVEYAVVVLSTNPQTTVGISEMGKRDLVKNVYVTSQPYQVGVLLSSANATTWTAHQDKDLTFRLNARKYDAANNKTREIDMGTITLPTDTTDLLISALTSTPATGADADFVLEFQDPQHKETVYAADGQIIKFPQARNGNVKVKARLRCTDYASATIEPGSQIIAGVLASTGQYISRVIDVDPIVGANQQASLTVTLETTRKGGNIKAEYAVVPTTTTGALSWQPVPTGKTNNQPENTPISQDRSELTWSGGAKITAAPNGIRLRLTVDGDPSSRPQLFNLRVSVV